MQTSTTHIELILSNDTVAEAFDHGPNVPDPLSAVDPFLIHFSFGDPENPKNWSNFRRWYITLAGGTLVLSAAFSSSAVLPVIPAMMEEFGFSSEVGTLTLSLFLCGYCVGPLIWAPLSEQYGRRPIFILSFFGFLCFQIGSALAKDTGSILVFRLLCGTFASASQANSGAMISDIWNAKERGTALAVFTVATFVGPSLGPIVGGYIYQAGVSWHWVFWILAIFVCACLLQIILTIPETYEPILLVKIAQEKRESTGDGRYYPPIERMSTKFTDRLEIIIGRPFKILFSELILFTLTIYLSFLYGCVYLLFEAFPVVYTQGHGLKPGPSGLVYLTLPVGCSIAVVVYVLFVNTDYIQKVERCAPEPVPPEYRLRVAMIASPWFAVSLFWFAWTSFPSISIWASITAMVVFSFSVCWIFLALVNYIVDVYLSVSASALAATVIARSMFGASFPLFGSQMYAKLGAEWASSLVGLIAFAMVPLPFIFSRYGPVIRSKSKFAPPPSSLRVAV